MAQDADTAAPAPAAAEVSPDPARTELITLEGLLYAETDPTPSDARQIGRLARESAQLLANGSALRPALLTYGESVAAEAEVATGQLSVEARDRWRDEWEELATARFEERDWLRGQHQEDLPAALAKAQIREAADALEALIRRARQDQARHGDAEITPENTSVPGHKARLKAWRDWCEQLEDDVADSPAGSLPRESDLPRRALATRAALGETRAAARLLADPPNARPQSPGADGGAEERTLPDSSTRVAWLAEVAATLERARIHLDASEGG